MLLRHLFCACKCCVIIEEVFLNEKSKPMINHCFLWLWFFLVNIGHCYPVQSIYYHSGQSYANIMRERNWFERDSHAVLSWDKQNMLFWRPVFSCCNKTFDTLISVPLVGKSFKTCNVWVDLEKIHTVQQIHSNFKQSCQIDRGHIKVSQNKFWYTKYVGNKKIRLSNMFFLSVLHEQTSVDSL